MSGFDQYYTQSELVTAIGGISYLGGGTFTGKALVTAKDALFAKGARAGVSKIACVLTAGKSQDNIGAPAQKLKDSGVTVISVGMGKYYDLDQLREMATDPDSKYMFKAEFVAFGSLVSSIVQIVLISKYTFHIVFVFNFLFYQFLVTIKNKHHLGNE